MEFLFTKSVLKNKDSRETCSLLNNQRNKGDRVDLHDAKLIVYNFYASNIFEKLFKVFTLTGFYSSNNGCNASYNKRALAHARFIGTLGNRAQRSLKKTHQAPFYFGRTPFLGDH